MKQILTNSSAVALATFAAAIFSAPAVAADYAASRAPLTASKVPVAMAAMAITAVQGADTITSMDVVPPSGLPESSPVTAEARLLEARRAREVVRARFASMIR